jgi:hypothetical protein
MRYLSNPSFAVAHVIMFTNDSSVILISAPLRNQHNCKEITMTNNKCNCVTCEAFNNGEVYYSEDNQVYNACETFKLYQFEMSDADWEDYYKVLL